MVIELYADNYPHKPVLFDDDTDFKELFRRLLHVHLMPNGKDVHCVYTKRCQVGAVVLNLV
jgi:hypothetical protein